VENLDVGGRVVLEKSGESGHGELLESFDQPPEVSSQRICGTSREATF
jgi:hypothetical protein